MRQRITVVLLSLILCAALPSPPAAAEGAEAVDDAWLAAATANDLEALAACYAEDAVLWAPGAPEAVGHEAIRATWGGMLEANTITGAAFTDTHYQTVGESSVGYGNFKLTMQPKGGGDPVVMTGRYSVVAVKRDGRWVYIMDHASAHPPPAEE